MIVLITLTPCWYKMTVTKIEKRENLKSEIFFSLLQSEIEHSAELMKSSSTNLSRFLSSALNAYSSVSFSDIETKVSMSNACSSLQSQIYISILICIIIFYMYI